MAPLQLLATLVCCALLGTAGITHSSPLADRGHPAARHATRPTPPLVPDAGIQTAFRPPAAVQLPAPGPRPRILASAADFERLHSLCFASPAASDAMAAAYCAALVEYGEAIAGSPINRTNIGNVTFLDIWDRITTTALLYRATGNASWAAVAVRELNVTGQLFNWGGPTYLEVAALSFATAVGYDWLHDAMTAGERAAVRATLVAKGIDLAQYDKYRGDFGGFTNRNIVANTGYLLGALAVWEEEPALAHQLWDATTAAMQHGLLMYDGGGWWEGYVYWGYATEHTLAAALSINNTFASSFGLFNLSGLERSGDYAVRMFSNATGHNYAYADSGPTNNEYAGILMWHNRIFPAGHRAFVARQMLVQACPPGAPVNASTTHHGRYPAWGLLFWDGSGEEADLAKALPLAAAFPNVSTAFARSSWSSASTAEDAASLASVKGGGTYWSHNHLDLGSFSFESQGVRWAQDLGLENYAAGGADNPGNYRITTLGHNTLVFNNRSQDKGPSWCTDPTRRGSGACHTGLAPLTTFNITAASTYAVVRLDTAYAQPGSPFTSWSRGLATFGGGSTKGGSAFEGIVVVDEFNATTNLTNFTWSLHTHATPSSAAYSSPSGLADHLILTQGGASVSLRVVEHPAGHTVDFVSVALNFSAPLYPDPGLRRLQLAYPGTAVAKRNATTRMAVALSNSPDLAVPPSRPLAEWAAAGPFDSVVGSVPAAGGP